MNLRDLEYLTVIAEENNFGRAAARCHVSQSTLSIQIKKLEETLGVQLFERNNRHVRLTAGGAEIAARARQMLQGAEDIRRIAKEQRDPLAGDVRLGAFPTLAPYLFPRCVGPVKQALPKIKLQLVEEKTALLVEMLEAGKLDCALIAAPVRQQGIVSISLFHEPFYVAMPAGHALAQKTSLTDAELAKLDLLLLDEGHCLRAQALEICQSIGTGESGRFRATSLETLRQMVAMGDAVTLMPKMAVRDDDRVRYVPLQNPSFGREITLCHRAASARGRLFGMLGDAIRQSVSA
ncbi:MAG: LysR family transcriptional regulator [Alphaproteobacteria bacterium]|nr:LysR family transcriptional regulator [Alphaproteobacteria bacterium]MDE2336108.1 LysR family transcriptional regulator [Alphaproteobacteria bacterium]